jgi:large subunit ribosomal protein L28
MSKVCELTGKRPITGNSVSHSNRKTKRRFIPNIQRKKFFVPEINDFVEVKVCASAIRTINKMGLYAYVRKLEKKGDFPAISFDLSA